MLMQLPHDVCLFVPAAIELLTLEEVPLFVKKNLGFTVKRKIKYEISNLIKVRCMVVEPELARSLSRIWNVSLKSAHCAAVESKVFIKFLFWSQPPHWKMRNDVHYPVNLHHMHLFNVASSLTDSEMTQQAHLASWEVLFDYLRDHEHWNLLANILNFSMCVM